MACVDTILHIVMALYSYSPIELWSYTVMALYSYGVRRYYFAYSYGPI